MTLSQVRRISRPHLQVVSPDGGSATSGYARIYGDIGGADYGPSVGTVTC